VTSLLVTGIILLGIGVYRLPGDLTLEERINPATREFYSLSEQGEVYKKKVLESNGFKMTMVACGILGILVCFSIGCCIYTRWKTRESNVVGAVPYISESQPSPLYNIAGMQRQSFDAGIPRASPELAV
jgi:hypothetical protein